MSKVNYELESQKALAAKGLYKGKLDGLWGEQSHKALVAALGTKITPAEPVAEKPLKSDPAKEGYIIDVVRFKESARSTISRFTCNWCDVSGYTLEPAGPSTTKANTNKRIPTGLYNLVAHSGAKYKNVVRLYNKDVPESRAVLIHQGNTPANTVACLLTGTTYGPDNVGASVAKLNELMKAINAIGADKVKLRITEQFK